uniref:Glycoside hydrolase family 31 N-terminal domain-containing protein n=1 Tax=Clastoptera arizonana TaxID=38151 RepID=A0A1B6CHQ1_9HEMI
MAPVVVPAAQRIHRRNSISLPAGLNTMEPPEYEPQLTPERVRHDGYDTSDTFSDAGMSEDDNSKSDWPTSKVPPRTRKKSVAPLQLKLQTDDNSNNGSQETIDMIENSPGNSITSINSISSLLKEKLMMTLPRAMRHQKPKEYKLQGFVAMLFLTVVFLIGFAHVFYHQQVLQRAYFDKIRFNNKERLCRVFNTEGQEIALGYLGTELPETDKVFNCLPEDQRYGGGRTLGMAWPVELGKVELSPFVTGHIGRHRWGSVLQRYFINSRGVAIFVDPETPLYVSINDDKSTRLCLQGRHDDFAYIASNELPQLNYTLCTSTNMKLLHSSLSEKSLWDGLKQEDVEVINALMTEPVWQIAPAEKHHLTEQAVINYTEDVIALGFLKQGHVLLNEFWQAEAGDFNVDVKRFPTMEQTIEIIHRRGFRIVLSVQPFISTESINFMSTVQSGILAKERQNESIKKVPALTSYKTMSSVAMLDVTNNNTQPWLVQQLSRLIKNYSIDSFYLDLGTAYDMPHYFQMEQNLTNPDHFKALFTNMIQSSVGKVIGVSGAITRPPAPIFVSLPSLSSTWESLQVIIPTTLTYGIVGYPFLMPGPVGGDYSLDGDNKLPDKELYIRWLQLVTFLPVIRYSYLPSQYKDDDQVLDIAKTLTALRQKTVNPLLKKYMMEALDSGTPLIRPLWMLDPSDTACHHVKDEFSIGEEIIVAPILQPNTHQREVYLPAGVWKDGIDSSLRKGSRWIHHYKVPLDRIAFFVRRPDNTRF